MVLLTTIFDLIAWTGFEKVWGVCGYEMIVWSVLASGQLWRVRNFSSTQNGPRSTIFLGLYILRTDLLRFLLTWVALWNYGIRVSWFMNEKILIIALVTILGIGFVGIMFVVFPWVFTSGFANWKQILIDDGLIIVCLIMFVYGFYMNTRMHWINIVLGWTCCHVSQWKLLLAPYFLVN